MKKRPLSKRKILKLLEKLNQKLSDIKLVGELYLVGGAVMCLVYESRAATFDLDAFFKPARIIRQITESISEEDGLDPKWLNDAVKGFLSSQGEYVLYLDLSNLKVYTAQPEYLLAMKCLSCRLGEETFDEEDIQFLLRNLNLDSYDEVIEIISHYYPIEKFPPKVFYLLEELLPKTKKA